MKETLARHSRLAFRRMRSGAALIKRFHNLPEDVRQDAQYKRVCSGLLFRFPFGLLISLAWPVASSVWLNQASDLGIEIQALTRNVGGATKKQRRAIQSVRMNMMSRAATTNRSSRPSTNLISKRNCSKKTRVFAMIGIASRVDFDVKKLQSDTGVIRRRMVSERISVHSIGILLEN